MSGVEYFFLVPSVILFMYAAYSDFCTWRIPNWTVLALVGLYAAGIGTKFLFSPNTALSLLEARDAAAGFFDSQALTTDAGAALLLFAMGVVFWCIRLFGAGDAKLFFPIGLFIGWIGLLPFAILLVLAGVVASIILKMPLPLPLQFSFFFMRLDEIRKTQKIPYGVIMVIAALGTIGLRLARGV